MKAIFLKQFRLQKKTSGFYDTQLLSDHEYLSRAEGQRGQLVVYRDAQTDSSFYFGEAMGDSITIISLEENKRQAQNGEIADMFKNNILITNSGAYYYIFLNAQLWPRYGSGRRHIYLLMGKADQMKKGIIQLSTDGAIQKQYNLENIGPVIFNFEKLPNVNRLYIVDHSIGRILLLNLDTYK